MSYSEKLKDPRWQKLRLKILERDDFTCQICCDGGSTLHVHHLAYKKDKEPWEYEYSSLVTLCEICHKLEKTDYNFERDFVGAFKEKFISYDSLREIMNAINRMQMPHVPDVVASMLCELLSNKEKMVRLKNDYFENLKTRSGKGET